MSFGKFFGLLSIVSNLLMSSVAKSEPAQTAVNHIQCSVKVCMVKLGLNSSQVYGTFTYDGLKCANSNYYSSGLTSCVDTTTYDCRTSKYSTITSCADVDPSGWG